MTRTDERRRLAMVYVLLLWCSALVVYRLRPGVEGRGFGMLWNLFLATVPLFWSAGFRRACGRRSWFLAAASFALWLLFLPNAPYLLTDMLHLRPRHDIPPWYLLAMLLSCAGTGTLLGYFSLMDVHREIEALLGRVAGWLVAAGSLMLCGFGIYLGRFLRWNSWNALNRPFDVGRDVIRNFIDPGPFPHPLAVTLVYGTGLIIGYIALRVIATPENGTSRICGVRCPLQI